MGHRLSKIPSEALQDDCGPQVKHLPITSKRSSLASAVDDCDLHSTSEKDKESSLLPLASTDAEGLQPAKLSNMNCAEEDDHSIKAVQSSEQVDMTKPGHSSHSIKASADTSNPLETSKTLDCGLLENLTVRKKLDALGDFAGPERKKIEEAAQALMVQVNGLLSLSIEKKQELGNDNSVEEALLQLCDCQATTCRAAVFALAYQVCTNIVTKNELLSQLNKELTDWIGLKKETEEVRQLAADRNDQLIESLKKRDESANNLIALQNQLADPHSTLYLRHKVKRLEQENVELPKLRARTQADQSELDRLRHTNAKLQGNADTTKKLFHDLGLSQHAHENWKRENNSLKKRASVTGIQEVEDKLHKANSRDEELQSTINSLESKLQSMQTITMDNTANDPSSFDINNDTDAVPVTTDEPEHNNIGLPKFQLASKAFPTEAIRALNYINKLNGTVVKRASRISGEQAGMGWHSGDWGS